MRFLKRMTLCVGLAAFFLAAGVWWQLSGLPEPLTMRTGHAHALPTFVAPEVSKVDFLLQKNGNQTSITPTTPGKYRLKLSALGLLRRTVDVQVVEDAAVMPGGQMVGIKLYMEGVLVVGLSEIPGTGRAPGKEADIRVGDRLLKIGDTPLESSAKLAEIVENSGGMPLTALREREGRTETVTLSPVYYADGAAYKLGLWVRDSAAGVGTLTYAAAKDGRFGALGHAIVDADTGKAVPIFRGAVTNCEIARLEKGERGAPGAVYGLFGETIGTISENGETGIYGLLSAPPAGDMVPIGLSGEVTPGPCTIYSSIAGGKVEVYAAEIEHVYPRSASKTKSMCVRITDPRLLHLAGGIVQGMSGSPIVQNGKLVGAVTHVFVNDPTRGYGIFIENMLAEVEN